jgi:hypothetical protein
VAAQDAAAFALRESTHTVRNKPSSSSPTSDAAVDKQALAEVSSTDGLTNAATCYRPDCQITVAEEHMQPATAAAAALHDVKEDTDSASDNEWMANVVFRKLELGLGLGSSAANSIPAPVLVPVPNLAPILAAKSFPAPVLVPAAKKMSASVSASASASTSANASASASTANDVELQKEALLQTPTPEGGTEPAGGCISKAGGESVPVLLVPEGDTKGKGGNGGTTEISIGAWLQHVNPALADQYAEPLRAYGWDNLAILLEEDEAGLADGFDSVAMKRPHRRLVRKRLGGMKMRRGEGENAWS